MKASGDSENFWKFIVFLFFVFCFDCLILVLQREYEEFKVRINALVAKAQKKPEDGWVMQDGTPWPGNNTRDHPGMIQVWSFITLLFSSLNSHFPV